MQHKMCRLVSGEMVMGTVIDDPKNTTETIMDTPMVIHFQPAANGQLGVNLFPLNPFATSKNEKIPIKNEHIMFWTDNVHPDIQAQYVEITSGIKIAQKNNVETPNLEITS